MKKQNTMRILLLAIMILASFVSNAQTRKDGMPDMRYKVNKQLYGSYNSSSSYNTYSTPAYSTPSYSAPSYSSASYSTPSYSAPTRTYSNGGSIYMQNGYMRSNGTYVAPHLKTRPDNNPYNNLSFWD